ncbi:DNA polymerase III subunit beta [Hoeflea sp.]|uniref:DNA polymerase III subunit beta n=1 Tax=Hoeflea sp. TaxID=1940281 RepID=UPI0019B6D933|nr:DNA polymerase III subunit beta [Hoeflea sp.]MBC7280000.1 DNA polymerase III subunit beta [Hoeflea sp.]
MTPFTLTCPHEALLAAVQTAFGAVERRNTIPVLANLLLEADAAGGLRVSGTDLDVMTSVVTGLPCEPQDHAGFTLPAALLHDILRKLPDKAEVTLKASDHGQAALSCGRSRFSLATLPAEDWPRLEPWRNVEPARFEVPATKFAAMLASVGFAISTEETRYYLNGVYMHALGDQLITVATDGHRLARAIYSVANGLADMPGVIIPTKTVGLVSKALDKVAAGASIGISVSEAMISFEIGAVRIASKLIDGTFPDYQRVIPEGGENRWRFDVAALGAAVERVSIISSERGRAIKMRWGRELLDLTVTNPDAGDGQEDMPVISEAGDDIEIGFNARYLGQMLAHMSGQATVAMASNGAPARFEPVHADDDEIEMTFVLMPMRV